jgi:hypothetical protein
VLGVSVRNLIPWQNWLLKLAFAAPLFWLLHTLMESVTAKGWMLLWGALACMLLAGGLLLLEWRQLRRGAGTVDLNP